MDSDPLSNNATKLKNNSIKELSHHLIWGYSS
jgi:hypothetical protein